MDKEASHPYIVEASTDCSNCQGKGHVQRDCDTCPNGVELAQCPACSGSGQVSRNPGQRMIIPHEDMDKGTPIQIVNPDININTHHREVCKQVMGLIIEALHLQKTDEAQSGVAKAIDQERLYKFINTISNDMFDKVIHDTLRDIIAYRNVEGDSTQAFRIIKPTQFRIKTSADLLNEYSQGTQAGMPVFIRQRMAMDFVDKQYSGDELMKKKARLITELDELSVLSTQEILDLRSAGAITAHALTYSRKLPVLLDELIQEKGAHWFVQANAKLIKELLQPIEITNTEQS